MPTKHQNDDKPNKAELSEEPVGTSNPQEPANAFKEAVDSTPMGHENTQGPNSLESANAPEGPPPTGAPKQIKQDNSHIYRRIIYITAPAFVELFLSSMFGAVDAAMVGRLGDAELAGVGLTNQPFFLLIAVFSAVNVGVTTLTSWAVGRKEPKKATAILKQAIIFNFIMGLILTIIGYLASPAIITFMGSDNPDNVKMIEHGIVYMRVLSIGVVFQALTMGITAALRGAGETRIPMAYNLVSNGLNVLLNWLLIYGNWGFPTWGVYGAGLATTIARSVATFIALSLVLFWKRSPLKIKIRSPWRLDKRILGDIMKIGLPAAGESVVIQTGLMLFTTIISSLGPIAAAAHQVVLQITNMAFSISQAFQVSTTTLVGQAMGSSEYDLAEKYVLLNRRAARVSSVAVAFIFIIFSEQLTRIFTPDIAVINTARPLFYFIAAIQFVQSSQMSTSGALRGAGDTMYPLYATIFGIWIFRVGLTTLLIKQLGYGLQSAWIAFFLDQALRSFIVLRRFKTGKWREIHQKRTLEMNPETN